MSHPRNHGFRQVRGHWSSREWRRVTAECVLSAGRLAPKKTSRAELSMPSYSPKFTRREISHFPRNRQSGKKRRETQSVETIFIWLLHRKEAPDISKKGSRWSTISCQTSHWTLSPRSDRWVLTKVDWGRSQSHFIEEEARVHNS